MIKTFKINKRIVLIALLIIIYIFCTSIDFSQKTLANSYKTPFILIDAGHGSPDGGATGTQTNVYESDLNLQYAKTLKTYFDSMNFRTEMVRITSEGLSDNKYEDMLKRKNIIEKSNCDIFISIHMNKFSLSSSIGAQTFFKQDDELSKRLAENIRDLLVLNIDYSRELCLSGDYLVLNSAKCPAVLIECGFLSNSIDELRLQESSFREKLCYQIFCGTIKFLNSTN